MTRALAALLLLHGLAHLPGFLVAWRLMSSPDLPYRTTLLAGRWDLGVMGMRVMGLFWLAAALGFAGAAVGAWRGTPGWPTLAMAVALASLVLSVLAWPDSRIGVAVNVVILLLLVIGGRADWFSQRT